MTAGPPGTPPDIRPVGPDDWQVVSTLRLTALRDAPGAFGSTYEREAVRTPADWRAWLESRDGARFVAYDGGEPAGLAGVYRRRPRGPVYELVAMWVRPQSRHAGIGRALVEQVVAWVADHGAPEVRLFVAAGNRGALAFYEGLGFVPTGWDQDIPGRPGVREHEFTRAVEPTCTVHVAWSSRLASYDFGPTHPMSPVRLTLTERLARELGVLDRPSVHVVEPAPASDAEIELVHTPGYVAAVRRVSEDPASPALLYGLGTEDNPTFAGMHDASALIVGGTLAAARAVWSGTARHGVNIAGGLHHAMPGHASGFCVYNDVAIAIQWLLDQGAARIAYVDVDVHHGDGVQAAFWDDPRVLTISIHESPDYLFPGTGYPSETGGPHAPGSALNIVVQPGTADAAWLDAFREAVPAALEAFGPTVLVSQQGCDSHIEDPLAHLALSVDAHRATYVAIHELAHAFAGGRWVATGGGGYAIVDVVPRSWTHLLAVASGWPLDPSTAVPEAWREDVLVRWGRVAPGRMTDGAG